MAIPAAPLLGAALLTALYTEMATTALASLLLARPVLCSGRRAHVRAVRETELAWREETFARPGEASPRPWRDPMSREIPVEISPSGGAPPGLERLVLGEFFWRYDGPWQAGPWYPGFHYADSSPRAHDGHAEVADGGEASRAAVKPPPHRHVWASRRRSSPTNLRRLAR